MADLNDQMIDQVSDVMKKAGMEVTVLPAQAKKKVSETTKVVVSALGGTALGFGIAKGIDAAKERKATTKLERKIKERDALDKEIAELQAQASKKADDQTEFEDEEAPDEE